MFEPRDRALVAVLILVGPIRAETPASADHFERKIRPLFVTHCLECHGLDTTKVKSGLRLTSRAEVIKGGERGPAVVPGDPGKSRLIQAIRYSGDLKMPPKGRLTDAEIADLEMWIKDGAVWPDVKTVAKIDANKSGPLFTNE